MVHCVCLNSILMLKDGHQIVLRKVYCELLVLQSVTFVFMLVFNLGSPYAYIVVQAYIAEGDTKHRQTPTSSDLAGVLLRFSMKIKKMMSGQTAWILCLTNFDNNN